MRLSARIAKLESKILGSYVGFRMRDGSMKYIASEQVDDALLDAVHHRPTPGVELLRAADPAIPASDGSKLHQLVQAILAAPYVPTYGHEAKEQTDERA